MTLEEKIEKLFRTISHGSRLSLHANQWEAFQKGKPFWKDEILALIKEETVKARINELKLSKISPKKFKFDERIAELQASLKDGENQLGEKS